MNKVNVCIFGAGGQLGSKLVESFVKNDLFNIYAIDKTFKKKISHENLKYFSLDIQNPLENELKKIPRENIVFINCIGLQHAFLSRNITKVNFHLNKNYMILLIKIIQIINLFLFHPCLLIIQNLLRYYRELVSQSIYMVSQN